MFNSLPKTSEGKIDKEAVKNLYLNGPYYSWQDFAENENFNSDLRASFPFSSWQKEWLEKAILKQNERITPSNLLLREEIQRARLQAIEGHQKINTDLRKLLAKAVENEIERSQPIKPKDLLILTTAAKNLLKSEYDSLFMSMQNDSLPTNPVAPPIEQDQDSADVDNTWIVEVIGGPFTADQLQASALEYLDKPFEMPTSTPENEMIKTVGKSVVAE